MRTIALAVLAILSAVLVSGCSGQEPGRPTSQSAPETTTTSKSSVAQAGPDLDVRKYLDRPCDLLKPDQVAQLGKFKASEVKDSATGKGCVWPAQDVTRDARYTVTIPPSGFTFESMLANAKSSPVFKETKIAGYPAYSFDITDGKGTCGTVVGTSREDAFLVQMINEYEASPEWKDSCGASEKVAALVVGNLKAGG